jgi:6-pyruvoyltetrahydropterin/6-carboxytetrahydropterin synthase
MIPGHPKCGHVHGHTYTLEVILEGPVNGDVGFVVDFSKIDEAVKKYIKEKLDHKYLNQDFNTAIPTCELLATQIFDDLKKELSLLKSIRLWEGMLNFVEYDGQS